MDDQVVVMYVERGGVREKYLVNLDDFFEVREKKKEEEPVKSNGVTVGVNAIL